MKKRIATWILICVTILNIIPVAAFARETDFFPELPDSFDFDSVPFDSSCVSQAEQACNDMIELIGEINNIGLLCEKYKLIIQLQSDIQTQRMIAMIHYYSNPEYYENEYSKIIDETNKIDQTILISLQSLFSDNICGPTMQLYAGKEQVESIMNATAPTDIELNLKEQEKDLLLKYNAAAAEEDSYSYNSQTWTVDQAKKEYYLGNISQSQYREILFGIYTNRSDRLGNLYLKLLNVRRAIAEAAGYSDYTHYAYEVIYSRDYSPEDVNLFSSYIRKYIVPLYKEMQEYRLSGCFTDGTYYDGFSESALLDAILPYSNSISSELEQSIIYLRLCNLINAEISDKKLPTCFTASLPSYNAAYIFCNRNGGNSDVSNLIHELGHFNAMIYGCASGCYDTLEVHSQGLEILYLPFAEYMYKNEAHNQVGKSLYDFLYLTLAGCVYDALQQYAYSSPTISVEDLNRKNAELSKEYGLTSFGPEGFDYSWIDITHNFESPLYYISYSTSALLALKLYQHYCETDFELAADEYLNFVSMSANNLDFRKLAEISGLGDPFSEGTIQSLAESFSTCLNKQVLKSPYSDTLDCWARDDITLLYLMRIMNGVSSDCFAPNISLSRAMAVTVLYRLCGSPETDTSSANKFTDVLDDCWYTEPIAWACDTGVIKGISDSLFAPDSELSCQHFALMLYRLLTGLDGAGIDDLGTGADPWAAEAVQWCSENSIFESEYGDVSPRAVLTRAELAAALINFLSVI